MTDYVISDEQLSAIELVLKFAGVTIKRNVLLSEIRSRPLSDELAKELEALKQEALVMEKHLDTMVKKGRPRK